MIFNEVFLLFSLVHLNCSSTYRVTENSGWSHSIKSVSQLTVENRTVNFSFKANLQVAIFENISPSKNCILSEQNMEISINFTGKYIHLQEGTSPEDH